MAKYRALKGFNLPDGSGGEVRIEQGEVVDLAPRFAGLSVLKDCIEKVTEPRPRKAAR